MTKKRDYLTYSHYLKSPHLEKRPDEKVEPFFFDPERQRLWQEIFDVLSFVIEKKKFTLQEIKTKFPKINRLGHILKDFSEEREAFILLKKSRKTWYFIGKIGEDG